MLKNITLTSKNKKENFMRQNGLLSVIIPSYNEEEMIQKTANTISEILAEHGIKFELIFVDDGSYDNTWNEIGLASKSLLPQYGYIRGIKFSRNFGKESAIRAGLEKAAGDCIAVIDCDLQHPPEKLVDMYLCWKDGYDVVEGIKSNRGKEGFLYKLASRLFYGFMSDEILSDMNGTSDFKLLDRRAVNEILKFKEVDPFFRAESAWVGFKRTSVLYRVSERKAGESKWTISSLTKYAIKNITSYSSIPTTIPIVAGLINLLLFLIFIILAIVFSKSQNFRLLMILSFLFLQPGVIMLMIGINAYYIKRVFKEQLHRPQFITEATINLAQNATRKPAIQHAKLNAQVSKSLLEGNTSEIKIPEVNLQPTKQFTLEKPVYNPDILKEDVKEDMPSVNIPLEENKDILLQDTKQINI